MALDGEILLDRLRRFADDDYGMFGGYPANRQAARDRWADAFSDYVLDMVVISPPTISPNNTSTTFSGVRAAFRVPLTLRQSMSEQVSATEMAQAWRAAIDAIVFVPGALFGGPATPTAISAIQPFPTPMLDARQTALRDTLRDLYRAPSIRAAVRLREIADALHTSSTGLTTMCTHATTGSPIVESLSFG